MKLIIRNIIPQCIFFQILLVQCETKQQQYSSFLPKRSVVVVPKHPNNNVCNNHQSSIVTPHCHLDSIDKAFIPRGGGGGGGDRAYGYDDRGYYDDDRYSAGGGGSQRGDYDDRYGAPKQKGSGYDDDFYGDSQDYKERDYSPSSSKRSKSSPLSNIPDVGGILRNGNKKIGLILLGAGMVFTMLGISLFFNKALMRLGNLFFIAGVPMTIGPGRTTGYFLQPKKSRATGCLALGIVLVFVGWPVVGIALEIFGILNLFGNMFPVLMVVLKQMPFVKGLLNGSNSGKSKKSSKQYDRKQSSRDRYSYDDEDDYNQDYEDKGDYSERSGYY